MNNRIRMAAVFALLSILSSFAGPVLWRQTLDGGAPDEGMGVQTDPSGNAYAAWMTYLAPRAWLMVSKLDVNGAEQWRASLPVVTAGPPRSGSCRIAVAGGDTYVVCHEDAADHSAFVARLAGDGSLAWTVNLTDISWPQAFESDGSAVYLAGTGITEQLAVKRFDSAGLSWSVPIVNAFGGGRPMSANQLVIANNDVLVTGWQETDRLDYGIYQVPAAFALRCGVDGTLHWLRSVTSTNRLNTRGNGIARLAAGDIVIGGVQSLHNTNGVTEVLDNLFVRFDAQGNELTRTALPRAGFIQRVLPIATGDVLTLGTEGSFRSTLRVTRTTADGAVQWVRVFQLNTFTQGDAAAVRWLNENQLLVAGYDYSAKSLYRLEVNVDTGKARARRLAIPGVASSKSGEHRNFNLDTQGNLFLLTGDGTPWPNVVAVKYRPLGREP